MKSLLAAAAVVMAVSAPPGNAEQYFRFMTGNQLLAECADMEDSAKRNRCSAYVIGVSDATMYFRATLGLPMCNPGKVTIGQARDVALKYLKEHPEVRHAGASELVAAAITDAFCPKDR